MKWREPINNPFLFQTEIRRMSVYKNYEAGEPTCRLYVKNIAKQVEEKVGTFIALDPLWFTGYDARCGVVSLYP